MPFYPDLAVENVNTDLNIISPEQVVSLNWNVINLGQASKPQSGQSGFIFKQHPAPIEHLSPNQTLHPIRYWKPTKASEDRFYSLCPHYSPSENQPDSW